MSDRGTLYRRSPFLLLQWEGSVLLLLHCENLRRYRVDHRLVALLTALGAWQSYEELAKRGIDAGPDDLAGLAEMGVLEEQGSQCLGSEPASYWDPVALLLHRRQNFGGSRPGDGQPVGPPPSGAKERPSGAVTVLPPSGPLECSLGEALEQRRTLRAYGRQSLKLDQLSTLLFHSARVVRSVHNEQWGEHMFRPFPGAGARSELEIYVVANQVGGLEPGAYWYDPRAHELIQVRGCAEYQVSLKGWVDAATGGELNREPQALLVITAVFARVMWKYSNIGLALIHQDTGCLYQTLYLTATALGLAPCAIGAGPERENAVWLGLDPLVESQVGCLLLGTRPEGAGH